MSKRSAPPPRGPWTARPLWAPPIWTALLVALWSVRAAAAPEAVLWQKWQAHNDASVATIDHGWWNRFLQSYVRIGQDGIARIPYARVGGSDRDALSADLSRLAALRISTYSRREQF